MVRFLVLVAVLVCRNDAIAAPDDNDEDAADPEDLDDRLPDVTAASTHGDGAALLAEANRELGAMHESRYEHHTHVDERSGHFDFDCSGFVGYALSRSAPDAFHAMQSVRARPLASSFESMFAKPVGPWTSVARADALRAGDVIAWLEPPEKHSKNTGHVMIVSAMPHAGARTGELIVSVIDSSHSGHGKADARIRDHHNGLGHGDIVLKVDADGHPIGYRWSTWSGSKLYRTTITLGRI